jgi:hypothetical protein
MDQVQEQVEDRELRLLVNLLKYDCTAQTCWRIVCNSCLSQGINIKIKGRAPSSAFQAYVDEHYTTFIQNSIQTMLATGFVPWRLCVGNNGVRIPEVVPFGSYHWACMVSGVPKNNNYSSKRFRESKLWSDTQSRFHVKRMDAKSIFKRQQKCVKEVPHASSHYKLRFVQGLAYSENMVEIYEYQQPIPSASSELCTPFRTVLKEYSQYMTLLRMVSYADTWNLQSRFLCGHTSQKDMYKLNETSVLSSECFRVNSECTGESTAAEFDMYARDSMTRKIIEQHDVPHAPVLYTLPEDTSVHAVAALSPIQDIEQSHSRLRWNICHVMGVPYEFVNSTQRNASDVVLPRHVNRAFVDNMTNLCKHLQNLLRVVYVSTFGGEFTDVEFELKPGSAIEVTSIGDIKTLIECGLVSCEAAEHLSQLVLGAGMSQCGKTPFRTIDIQRMGPASQFMTVDQSERNRKISRNNSDT